MPVLLYVETSSSQGSIIPPHFQFLLDSLRPFPSWAPWMGVSDRFLHVSGTAVSPASLTPCHQLNGIFGLSGTTYHALEGSGKTAKIMLELYFSFLF